MNEEAHRKWPSVGPWLRSLSDNVKDVANKASFHERLENGGCVVRAVVVVDGNLVHSDGVVERKPLRQEPRKVLGAKANRHLHELSESVHHARLVLSRCFSTRAIC